MQPTIITSYATSEGSNADLAGSHNTEQPTSIEEMSESDMGEGRPTLHDCVQDSGSHCSGRKWKHGSNVVVYEVHSQGSGQKDDLHYSEM